MSKFFFFSFQFYSRDALCPPQKFEMRRKDSVETMRKLEQDVTRRQYGHPKSNVGDSKSRVNKRNHCDYCGETTHTEQDCPHKDRIDESSSVSSEEDI